MLFTKNILGLTPPELLGHGTTMFSCISKQLDPPKVCLTPLVHPIRKRSENCLPPHGLLQSPGCWVSKSGKRAKGVPFGPTTLKSNLNFGVDYD